MGGSETSVKLGSGMRPGGKQIGVRGEFSLIGRLEIMVFGSVLLRVSTLGLVRKLESKIERDMVLEIL